MKCSMGVHETSRGHSLVEHMFDGRVHVELHERTASTIRFVIAHKTVISWTLTREKFDRWS